VSTCGAKAEAVEAVYAAVAKARSMSRNALVERDSGQ
jgi:hypothetical protein